METVVNKKAKAVIVAGIVVALLGFLAVTWIIKENPDVIAFVENVVEKYGLVGVFAATIIAGTIIPAGSPIVVASASGFGLALVPLTLVAASGYTLGTATCYALAYFLGEKYVLKHMSKETFESLASEWNRKGYILCVFFSLIPGFPVDLLAIVCGMLKTKPLLFFTICWITLAFQFAICAWLGKMVGSWLLP